MTEFQFEGDDGANRIPADKTFKPRTVVIDPDTQTRFTFHLAFPTLDVVAELSQAVELVESPPQADLIVMDFSTPPSGTDSDVPALQGPAAIHALTRLGYPLCLYTRETRPLVLAHALAAGASGIARKGDPLSTIESAFFSVAAGRPAIAASLLRSSELLNQRRDPPFLSLRQRQVLRGRARGESWKMLADRLGISVKTAYDRLEAVRQKLAPYLHETSLTSGSSPADIERALGLTPGDIMDAWPPLPAPSLQRDRDRRPASPRCQGLPDTG